MLPLECSAARQLLSFGIRHALKYCTKSNSFLLGMRLGKYILKLRILKLATFYIERVDFRCDDNLGYTVNVRSLCRQHTYEVILVFAQARL